MSHVILHIAGSSPSLGLGAAVTEKKKIEKSTVANTTL
jgi:hypothetical protein